MMAITGQQRKPIWHRDVEKKGKETKNENQKFMYDESPGHRFASTRYELYLWSKREGRAKWMLHIDILHSIDELIDEISQSGANEGQALSCQKTSINTKNNDYPSITDQQLRVLSRKHLMVMLRDLEKELQQFMEERERTYLAYQAGLSQGWQV